MSDSKRVILDFKDLRAREKKKALTHTFCVDRYEHIHAEARKVYPEIDYLNASEQMDFLMYLLEGLMIASQQFPEMMTIRQKGLIGING